MKVVEMGEIGAYMDKLNAAAVQRHGGYSLMSDFVLATARQRAEALVEVLEGASN